MIYALRMAAGLLLLASGVSAEARHVQTAQVRYETRSGSSDWYSVDVTFVTGREMNQATRSFDYSTFEKYAVIFWGEGQATIIEIDDYIFGCGTEFSASCIPRYGNLNGDDKEGRKWEICTARYC